MISIITPSIREDGLEIVRTALKRQTYKDYEWLVGSPFLYLHGTWIQDDFEGGYWSLNRIYNKLIDNASCEHIVSWQDFTFADPDALEKFVYHFKTEPNTFVTAVGNKYTSVYPILGEKVWQDPRETDRYGTYYPCYCNDIEWNLCSFPRQALYDIGGFMEDFDFEGYGMDGYGVLERVNEIGGYDFKINQTIRSYSLTHDRYEDWDTHNLINGGYEKMKRRLKKKGVWPVARYLTT